jgi:transposase, IS30 family
MFGTIYVGLEKEGKAAMQRETITQRPEKINNRSRLGDWERDLMCGLNRSALLICVERKSRFLKISKLNSYKAVDVFSQTQQLLAETGTEIKSITNDNGPEFNDGYLSAVPIYYCQPQKPQQRGTVENTIGLLRQYHSRKSDLSEINNEGIVNLENKMNSRPRRCLDYRTPYEVLYNVTVALVS